MDLKEESDEFVKVKSKSKKRKADEVEASADEKVETCTVAKRRPNLPRISNDKLLVRITHHMCRCDRLDLHPYTDTVTE